MWRAFVASFLVLVGALVPACAQPPPPSANGAVAQPSIEVVANSFVRLNWLSNPQRVSVILRDVDRSAVGPVALHMSLGGAPMSAWVVTNQGTSYDYSDPSDPNRIRERLDYLG